jgi:hypothetical protein
MCVIAHSNPRRPAKRVNINRLVASPQESGTLTGTLVRDQHGDTLGVTPFPLTTSWEVDDPFLAGDEEDPPQIEFSDGEESVDEEYDGDDLGVHDAGPSPRRGTRARRPVGHYGIPVSWTSLGRGGDR